jgi:hypothetical protein
MCLEHFVGCRDYRCILMAIDHRSTLVCSGTVVWESHNGDICHHHLGTAVCTTEISASVYGHSSKRGRIEIHIALHYTTSLGVNMADGNFLLPKERKGWLCETRTSTGLSHLTRLEHGLYLAISSHAYGLVVGHFSHRTHYACISISPITSQSRW